MDIIQNFLAVLKTKQLKDWDTIELETFLDEIDILYRYCSNKEECTILENIYIKIADWCNKERGFIRYSRNHLSRVKLTKKF